MKLKLMSSELLVLVQVTAWSKVTPTQRLLVQIPIRIRMCCPVNLPGLANGLML